MMMNNYSKSRTKKEEARRNSTYPIGRMVTRKQYRRSNKKQLRGGKYVFQGTYGCAFRPSLACQGDNGLRRQGTISKLMALHDAAPEFKQKALLAPIDPNQDYLLYPNHICKPDMNAITPENQYEKCTVRSIKGYSSNSNTSPNNNSTSTTYNHTNNSSWVPGVPEDQLRLLFFKNGGDNLNAIQVPQKDYTAFFKSLLSLFEGLALMHEHNLVHLDIKTLNLVSMRNQDGSYSSRIIDFGFVSETEPFNTRTQDTLYSNPYIFWPIELFLLSDDVYANQLNPSYLRTQLNQYKSSANMETQRTNYAYMGWPATSLTADSVSTLLYTILKQTVLQVSNPEEVNVLYLPSTVVKTADVYGLGLALGEVYSRLTGHTLHTPTNVRSNPSIPREYNDSLIKEKVSQKLLTLVYNMVHPEYEKRYTIQQARDEYIACMPYFEYFLSSRIDTNRSNKQVLLRQTSSRHLNVPKPSFFSKLKNTFTRKRPGINTFNSNPKTVRHLSPVEESHTDPYTYTVNPAFQKSRVTRKYRTTRNHTRRKSL